MELTTVTSQAHLKTKQPHWSSVQLHSERVYSVQVYSVLVYLLLLFATLLFSTKNSFAQEVKENTNTKSSVKTHTSYAGKWSIKYKDRLLGAVSGKAIVSDDEKSARISLYHPVGKKLFVFRTTKLSKTVDGLQLSLQGEWPGAYQVQDAGIGLGLQVGKGSPYEFKGPNKLEVNLGKASKQLRIKPHQKTTNRTIEITLKGNQESLIGQWQQSVNAETGRDASGGGRIGEFSFLKDGTGKAVQSGIEAWSRVPLTIVQTIPVSNQLQINEVGVARFPYPWDENQKLVSPLSNRRILYIMGVGLPTELNEKVTLKSINPNIEYRIVARQWKFDSNTYVKGILDYFWENQLEKYSLVSKEYAEQKIRKWKKYDGLLVEAIMKPGSEWGLTGFYLNDVETSWVLEYGDNLADISIVRPISSEQMEPIDYTLAPEQIRFEVRSKALLPGVTQIPLLVGINGKIKVFNKNSRLVMAVRQPVSLLEKERVAAAKKSGIEDARVTHIFRTREFAVVANSEEKVLNHITGDDRLLVTNGDKIQVRAGQDGIIVPSKGITQATVITSLSEFAPASAKNFGVYTLERNMTWLSAKRAALECQSASFKESVLNGAVVSGYSNLSPARQDKILTNKVVGTINNYNWTEIPWRIFQESNEGKITDLAAKKLGVYKLTRSVGLDLEWWFGRTNPEVVYSVNIKLGDHAAMFLVRDAFIELMTIQISNMGRIKSDIDVEAFRRRVQPIFAEIDEHPLADISVKDTKGGTTRFRHTFGQEWLKQETGLKGAELRRWKISAGKEAIKKYIESMEHARKKMQDLDTCDVDEMLKYTGLGQQNIQMTLLSRLMDSAPTAALKGNEWKPDREARSWVLGLNILGGAVQSQQEMSDLDTTLFSIAASVGTLGAGSAASLIGYETLSLRMILYAIDLIDVVREGVSIGLKKYETSAEYEFALGASAVSGPARFQQAKLDITPWYLDFVSLSLSSLDLALVLAEGPSLYRELRKAWRAKKAVAKFILIGDLMPTAFTPVTITSANVPPLVRVSPTNQYQSLLGEVSPKPSLDIKVQVSLKEFRRQANTTIQINYQEGKKLIQEAEAAGRQLTSVEIAKIENIKYARELQKQMDELIDEAIELNVNQVTIRNILGGNPKELDVLPTIGRLRRIQQLSLNISLKKGYFIVDGAPGIELQAIAKRVISNTTTDADVQWLKYQIDLRYSKGERFFDNLTRAGSYSEKNGYELLLDENTLEAVRRFSDKRGLLRHEEVFSKVDEELSSLVLNKKDFQALSPKQQEEIFQGVIDSKKLKRLISFESLTESEVNLLKFADSLTPNTTGTAPDWALGLSRKQFVKSKDFLKRSDFIALVKDNSAAMGRLIDDPLAFNVIERQPWLSLDELRQGIEIEKKRIIEQILGFFEATRPKGDLQVIDGITLKQVALKLDGISNRKGKFLKHIDLRIHVDNKQMAHFSRSLEEIILEDGRVGFEMGLLSADAKDVPRYITGIDKNLINNEKSPLAVFMATRAFHALGVGRGNKKLLKLRLDTIYNANATIQIEWMKNVYGANYQKYLKHTHAVRYVESSLTQAGYKIKSVYLERDIFEISPALKQVESEYFNSKESPLAYLKRYGVDPNTKVERGYHIMIDVEPL